MLSPAATARLSAVCSCGRAFQFALAWQVDLTETQVWESGAEGLGSQRALAASSTLTTLHLADWGITAGGGRILHRACDRARRGRGVCP